MRPIHNAERDVHVVLQWHRIWRRHTKNGRTLPTSLVYRDDPAMNKV
jgi:hypothetical protein